MIKIDLKQRKREVLGVIAILFVIVTGMSIYKYASFSSGFEITDDLGGNIFPSAILSVATTDAQVIEPSDSFYIGNPKSCIAIRVKSRSAYSRYVLKWRRLLSFHVPYPSLSLRNRIGNIRFIKILSGTTKR